MPHCIYHICGCADILLQARTIIHWTKCMQCSFVHGYCSCDRLMQCFGERKKSTETSGIQLGFEPRTFFESQLDPRFFFLDFFLSPVYCIISSTPAKNSLLCDYRFALAEALLEYMGTVARHLARNGITTTIGFMHTKHCHRTR